MPSSSPKSHSAKLLVVDDEATVRMTFAEALRGAGYRVIEAADGVEALEKIAGESPDLVVLDIDMPKLDGREVLRRMRDAGHLMPVLMLTVFNSLDDRVRGLGLGADDYLGKPCHERELVARAGALLRRGPLLAARPELLAFGDTTVDLRNRVTVSNGAPVSLTKTEYAFLELLANEHGRPVSREKILDAVWGYARDSETRTVETHVWRLRAKLGDNATEPRWIRTVTGVGYQLVCDQIGGDAKSTSRDGKVIPRRVH
jgi:DNA-binding response OmpR family regulator